MDYREENDETARLYKIWTLIFIIFIFLMVALFPLTKWYSVWSKGMSGKAEFAQAGYNRKIKILEAEAFKESAKSYAEAEIIRSRGVAEANEIIGQSLKGNEAYLRYRWIEGLQTNQMQVVYVPTEAGLPILEAGKGNFNR